MLWSEVALGRKKDENIRTSHISLGDQTGTGPGNASGPFGLHVGARTRMTVTVVSAASDGGKVNESRVGNTGRKRPDGWGKRDCFFYYFKRRRHLVVGVRGKRSRESWLVVVNSGTIRRMRSREFTPSQQRALSLSDLFYQLSGIRLPSVLRILRRHALRCA